VPSVFCFAKSFFWGRTNKKKDGQKVASFLAIFFRTNKKKMAIFFTDTLSKRILLINSFCKFLRTRLFSGR
jgi:hypothetical protein